MTGSEDSLPEEVEATQSHAVEDPEPDPLQFSAPSPVQRIEGRAIDPAIAESELRAMEEPPLFSNYEFVRPRTLRRIPNLGDFLVFALLAFGGSLGSGLLVLGALHFHVFWCDHDEAGER